MHKSIAISSNMQITFKHTHAHTQSNLFLVFNSVCTKRRAEKTKEIQWKSNNNSDIYVEENQQTHHTYWPTISQFLQIIQIDLPKNSQNMKAFHSNFYVYASNNMLNENKKLINTYSVKFRLVIFSCRKTSFKTIKSWEKLQTMNKKKMNSVTVVYTNITNKKHWSNKKMHTKQTTKLFER